MNRKILYVTSAVLVLIAFVVLLFLRPDSTIREEELKVRIGYQQTILYLPIFIAQENGYFEKHGVNVQLINFGSAPEMMQALLAGHIDLTGMSALDVIASVEQEESGQLKLYLIEALETNRNFSPDYIIASKNSSIKKLEDLKNKRLGIYPGITIETYTRIILKKLDINADKDMELIKLSGSLQLQALETGQVDALFTFDPIATIILELGNANLVEHAVLAKYIMDEPTTIYPGSGVFSTEFVNRNPEASIKVRAAIYEAVDFINENPERAKYILPKYTPISYEIAEKVSIIKWVRTEDVDPEELQDIIDLYYDNGILERKVDLRNAYFKDVQVK